MTDVIAVTFRLNYGGAIEAHLSEISKLAVALKDKDNRDLVDNVINSFTKLTDSKPADGRMYSVAIAAKTIEEAREFQHVFGSYCSVDCNATLADSGHHVTVNQLCEPL